MKFPTLMGEIVTVKANQKQARCYAESLKVTPYPPTREFARPHPVANGDTQVISMDERSSFWALTVYQASLDDVFDVNLRNETVDKGPKPSEI